MGCQKLRLSLNFPLCAPLSHILGVECGVSDRSYVQFHGQILIGHLQSAVSRYSNVRETTDGVAGWGFSLLI